MIVYMSAKCRCQNKTGDEDYREMDREEGAGSSNFATLTFPDFESLTCRSRLWWVSHVNDLKLGKVRIDKVRGSQSREEVGGQFPFYFGKQNFKTK